MNENSQARRSAIRLQRDMDRLHAALRIRDKAARNAALRDYYTQIPTRGYELGLIVFNTAASVSLAAWTAHSFALRPQLIPFVPLALVVAFFLADAVSAAFHKWFDCYAGEAHWLWGTGARAFRVHHEFPNNLNELTLVRAMAPLAPIMSLFYVGFFLAALALSPGPLLSLVAWTMIQIFAIGNEIHKQAHRPTSPAWIRLLQRCGFFLRSSVHSRHHRGVRDTDYGIVNGWSNGLLDWLDVWNRMDLFLWRSYRLFPRNWIQAPGSIPPCVLSELKDDPSLIPAELAIYGKALPGRTSKGADALFSARSPAQTA